MVDTIDQPSGYLVDLSLVSSCIDDIKGLSRCSIRSLFGNFVHNDFGESDIFLNQCWRLGVMMNVVLVEVSQQGWPTGRHGQRASSEGVPRHRNQLRARRVVSVRTVAQGRREQPQLREANKKALVLIATSAFGPDLRLHPEAMCFSCRDLLQQRSVPFIAEPSLGKDSSTTLQTNMFDCTLTKASTSNERCNNEVSHALCCLTF